MNKPTRSIRPMQVSRWFNTLSAWALQGTPALVLFDKTRTVLIRR